MTQPDPAAGAQQEAPFMPEPHFAVQAQQEEIQRLAQAERHLNDRIIYLRAVALQVEAMHDLEKGQLRGEIADRDAKILELESQLLSAKAATNGHAEPPLVVDAPEQNGKLGVAFGGPGEEKDS